MASERGTANRIYVSWQALYVRGCGAAQMLLSKHQEVTKGKVEQNCLERQTKDGDSPVSVTFSLPGGNQVPRDTCNPVGIWEDHLPRLNTTQ